MARSAESILRHCFKKKEIHSVPNDYWDQDGWSYWLLPNGDFHYMGDAYIHNDVRMCLQKGKDYTSKDRGTESLPRKFERLTGAIKTSAFRKRVEYEVSLDKEPTGKQEKAMREICEVKGDCRLTVFKPNEKYCFSKEIAPREIAGAIRRCKLE